MGHWRYEKSNKAHIATIAGSLGLSTLLSEANSLTLHITFKLVESLNCDIDTVICIPAFGCDELLALTLVAPHMRTRLKTPVDLEVSSVDASGGASGGLGGTYAQLSSALVHEIYRCSDTRGSRTSLHGEFLASEKSRARSHRANHDLDKDSGQNLAASPVVHDVPRCLPGDIHGDSFIADVVVRLCRFIELREYLQPPASTCIPSLRRLRASAHKLVPPFENHRLPKHTQLKKSGVVTVLHVFSGHRRDGGLQPSW